MHGAFRSKVSFGKRQEFLAITELVKKGFDVFIPLVDDHQVDCVARKIINGKPVYIDIQIKARSKECDPKTGARFPALTINPRENYFFIFYSERLKTYWVVPSTELVKIANRNKKGLNAGKYTIDFGLWSKTKGLRKNPKFEKYENNFELLKEYCKNQAKK